MHHTCGALRTMRSMQRTPHIVRRLVLGVQHATCSMQHATRSIQHATRPIPTAAMRSQPPPLSERTLHCAAPSVQHPSHKHTTYTLHHATRNIPVQHEPSHWPARQVSYNPQHATCKPKCNIVCTPCHIKRARTVRSERCNKHRTPCNVLRTPCNVLMQHAQLAATRIAHHRRACDAAALELHGPIILRHHATILHTAAPLHLRPDRRSPATRTFAVVSEIATDSNVALPTNMRSTPPS